MNIYLDIETLPTNNAEFIKDIASTISAPANYTKPESIQKWIDENFAAALAEKIAKTSFDGAYGRACVICAAIDDEPVVTFYNNDEAKLLSDFYDWLKTKEAIPAYQRSVQAQPTFVGHNVAAFDLPFLKHRSIVLGIKPPASLLKAMNAKAWDACIADTMLMWSQDREKRASMNKLCKVFGIADKGDMDGSKVAETWLTDQGKVANYCAADVERTRQIYKRLTFDFSPQEVALKAA